jgi:hypothetical protein
MRFHEPPNPWDFENSCAVNATESSDKLTRNQTRSAQGRTNADQIENLLGKPEHGDRAQRHVIVRRVNDHTDPLPLDADPARIKLHRAREVSVQLGNKGRAVSVLRIAPQSSADGKGCDKVLGVKPDVPRKWLFIEGK